MGRRAGQQAQADLGVAVAADKLPQIMEQGLAELEA
jgi:hypothetical protein